MGFFRGRTMLAALVLASIANAEDVLYSKRHLSRRQLDNAGNYNMCTLLTRWYVNWANSF